MVASLPKYNAANRSYSFNEGWGARLSYSATPRQCPNIGHTEQVRFKSHPASTGIVYIGFSSASATTIQGYPLNAGEDTGWIPINALDKFWYVMSDSTTYLNYMVVRDHA